MLNKEYEIELFIDFLIVRNNTKEIIKEYEQEILDTFDYNELLYSYQKLANSDFYSQEQLENFKEVLNFIIEKRIENNKDELETECLKCIKDDISSIEPSYDFYYQEFVEKFNNLDDYINNNCQMITKKELDESVQYDYFVYKYLTNKLSLDYDFNKIINYNFVLSINKFLSENPELFLDENFKKRAINSLNLIMAYYEENNIEIDNNYINKIINIINNVSTKKTFDIDNLRWYNIQLLINKIIVDNRKFDDTEYKDIILTDYFIKNLKETFLILKRTNTSKYYNFEVKDRLEYLLNYILNHRHDNKTKIDCNEMFYLLNGMTFSKLNYFLYDEASLKYTGFAFFKKAIIKWLFGRDISLEEDMKISIGRDYDTLSLLLSKEEIDVNKIDPYTSLSIKKFLREIPEIFDSDIISAKVDKILTSDKVYRKR